MLANPTDSSPQFKVRSPSMLLFGVNQTSEVNDEVRRMLDNIVFEDVVDLESMGTEATIVLLNRRKRIRYIMMRNIKRQPLIKKMIT